MLLEGQVRSQGGQRPKGSIERDQDIFGPTVLPGGHQQIVTEGGRFTGAIETKKKDN